ncbi:Hypothetical predicted protein [Paramuricea clavata]|uniref:Uncharacterized protein n=1 Tax=Paramuricea clavata TaxID=317549 RepID=A0A7D9LIJ3_PARCT|nr:Hypothetical predicted protein [Paramuricea clavata]
MAPVTIRFRIDLQNLWAAGYQWDELLPNEEKFKWQKNVEIMNALLGTHLERCLKPETSVGSPQLQGFSDAGELGYALSWIKSSPAEFKPFVSVRVAEIQEKQPTAVWNYITSEANPADALTRGIMPEELQLWHHGPQFIQKPEND